MMVRAMIDAICGKSYTCIIRSVDSAAINAIRFYHTLTERKRYEHLYLLQVGIAATRYHFASFRMDQGDAHMLIHVTFLLKHIT